MDPCIRVRHVPAAHESPGRTDPEFRQWLRELRESAGMTQEALAAAVGTDRRNIRRWEAEGHDPGGTVLLRVLSALGVRVEPPARTPRAVNAALDELAGRLLEAEERAAARHDQVLARLDAQDTQLRTLAMRLEDLRSRFG